MNISDTAARPSCELWGISRPVSGSSTVVCGERLNALLEDAGPMLTFWKKFWKAMDSRATPTCDGYGATLSAAAYRTTEHMKHIRW